MSCAITEPVEGSCLPFRPGLSLPAKAHRSIEPATLGPEVRLPIRQVHSRQMPYYRDPKPSPATSIPHRPTRAYLHRLYAETGCLPLYRNSTSRPSPATKPDGKKPPQSDKRYGSHHGHRHRSGHLSTPTAEPVCLQPADWSGTRIRDSEGQGSLFSLGKRSSKLPPRAMVISFSS